MVSYKDFFLLGFFLLRVVIGFRRGDIVLEFGRVDKIRWKGLKIWDGISLLILYVFILIYLLDLVR